MGKRITVHPGKVILHDYLEPLGMTRRELARRLGVDEVMVGYVVNEKRGLSFDMAYRLAKVFKTSFEFWSGLQFSHDQSRFLAAKGKKSVRRRRSDGK